MQDDLPTPPQTPPTLKGLRARIATIKAKETAKQSGGDGDSELSGYAVAMRMSIELLAGVVVGGGLGYALDRWIGSLPGFLIFGIIFGFFGGVRNIMRMSK